MATKHKGKVRRIVVEPSDNGGFITRTEREMSPNEAKGPCCYGDRDEKAVHGNVEQMTDHLRKTFGGGSSKSKAKSGKKGGAASDLAREMLAERS